MRKFLCVSAVAVSALFGAIPAAQAQFKVTPEVGIALLKDGDDRATVSPRLGMSVDYFFNKQANGWAVTSGLYYYWKRESYSIAQGFVADKDGKEDWIPFPFPEAPMHLPILDNATALKRVDFLENDIRRDYLQVPVLAKYKWEINWDYALSVAAGLYFALGVGGDYELRTSSYQIGTDDMKASVTDSSPYDVYDRFDMGFSSRLSFQAKRVSLNLNYETNFYQRDWLGHENLVSVSAGYTF